VRTGDTGKEGQQLDAYERTGDQGEELEEQPL